MSGTTPPPDLLSRATAAVAEILDHHRRALSPTGLGVRCTCGATYPTRDTYQRHIAELTTEAVAEVLA